MRAGSIELDRFFDDLCETRVALTQWTRFSACASCERRAPRKGHRRLFISTRLRLRGARARNFGTAGEVLVPDWAKDLKVGFARARPDI